MSASKKMLFAVCGVLACEATGFEPEYVVDTLRVLAVQADLPFAAPGESVHFTTKWADPNGAGRVVQWAWGTCVNPGSSQVPDCANALRSLAFGGDTFVAAVPNDALDAAPIGELGVIFAACAGTLTLDPNGATGAPVTCTNDQGALASRDGFVWGGTRVVIAPGVRNANPVIDKVFIDGAEWAPTFAPQMDSCTAKNASDCPSSTSHVFSYAATADSAESYDLGAGPQTEALVGWFYVTQGSLTAGYASPDADDAGAPLSPPTFEMTFTPTLANRAAPLHLWLVLRDDRGGIAYAERDLAWK